MTALAGLASLTVAGSAVAVLSILPGSIVEDMTAGDPAPCAVEDSPGPCVWDADTRGNGVGRSFYRDANGHVTFLD